MAGALTLVIMNLPTIMRTTQESLKTVPQSYREGAFGLGAGKWRVIRTVVLPGCVDGVITGCILSVGRILGESAALLFTAGFAHALNGIYQRDCRSAGATLTVALYVYAKEQGEFGVAFAIAAILMVLTLLINHLAAATLVRQAISARKGRSTMSNIITVKDLCLWYGNHQGAQRYQHRHSRKEHHRADRPLRLRQIHLSENAEPHERPDPRRARSPGSVHYKGEDIYRPVRGCERAAQARSAWCSRSRIPFPMSIYDNVAYGPRTHGITATRRSWTRSWSARCGTRPSGMR